MAYRLLSDTEHGFPVVPALAEPPLEVLNVVGDHVLTYLETVAPFNPLA